MLNQHSIWLSHDVLGLVGIEIVENDMNFSVVAVGVYDAIHEIQELPASTGVCNWPVLTKQVAVEQEFDARRSHR